MARSSRFLRDQLLLSREALRRSIDEVGGQVSDDMDPWVLADHQRRIRRVQEIEADLAAVSERLSISFDGRGIHDRGAEFGRAREIVQAVGQSIRWTARDLLVIDGDMDQPDKQLLAEPILAGTFPGSFGIEITRSPAEEILSLFHEPLFDRTADRFLQVFRAGQEADGRADTIIDSVAGLRKFALGGYKKVAQVMGKTGGVARISWQGQTVAVTPRSADFIDEVLGTTHDEEEVRTIRGVMPGGDVADERFHLVPDDGGDDDLPHDIRGAIEPALLPRMRLLTYDSRVEAEVAIIYTLSDLVESPRRVFVLRDVRALEGGRNA